MLPFGRSAVFHLFSSSPSLLTQEHGLSPRTTLNVHDCDGEGREWVVQGSVAKVSIYQSKNIAALHLPGRILTSTVEIWSCSNVNLVIGPVSPDESSPLGTLQLDPSLHDISIRFTSPASVGKIIIAPSVSQTRDGRPTFGFSNVTLRVGDEEPFVLADADGNLYPSQEPTIVLRPTDPPQDAPAQWVVGREGGMWKADGLERGEKDYPVLA
ncbi:hypothetical protein JCM21900_003157 [Sporobolomyces salmonicolor]